jgi:hypothetical protein
VGVDCLAASIRKISALYWPYSLELCVDLRNTTPWFHATDIPNVPPENLVQISIGGW